MMSSGGAIMAKKEKTTITIEDDNEKDGEEEARGGVLGLMDRAIKLVVKFTALIIAIGALGTAVYAHFGVSDNKDAADEGYQALVAEVNQLSKDVAYIKGRIDGRAAARHAPPVPARFGLAMAVAAVDAVTDAEPAPLPPTLDALMQAKAQITAAPVGE
jgi:hypothetical protein